jgi:hypothetical protein
MTTQRSLRTRAARRNTLAACLAVALAAGGVGAADIAGFPATSRIAGAKASPPMRPAGNNLPVTNCLDDGSDGSLRQVIAGAIDGDVIDLSALTCSTITLQSGAIRLPASVSIKGPGQTALTIDGGGTNRVFLSKYDMAISDITITNGRADGDGGCVDVIESDLTLTRTTFTGCHAGHVNATQSRGGGIYVGGNLWMDASTISGSSATANSGAYGGGAYVVGNAYLDDSSIDGNGAVANGKVSGGGLFVNGEEGATVTRSRITDNSASSDSDVAKGGGIFGSATISLSTISGNASHSDTKASYGGGMHGGGRIISSTLSDNTVSSGCSNCLIMGGGVSAFAEINVYYSTIRGNQAFAAAGSAGVAAGGGLAADTSSDAVIFLRNSTISGNFATGGDSGGKGYGGGLAAIGGPFTAQNSTIAFNVASHFGGGATGKEYQGAGTYQTELYSSIVANNVAVEGADLAPTDPQDSLEIAGSNNLVMAASGNVSFVNEQPLQGAPLLESLACNGGPTATHALAEGSPAIDAGFSPKILYDQRGSPFARAAGVAADIGAFELQIEAPDYIFRSGFDSVASACP